MSIILSSIIGKNAKHNRWYLRKLEHRIGKIRSILCLSLVPGKRQNLRVDSYTENMLKWFNYPHTRAHPGCEVSCHGTESTCIVGLSVIWQGQPDSGESCIVLQTGPTHSLIAKFLQRSVIAYSMQISCCSFSGFSV